MPPTRGLVARRTSGAANNSMCRYSPLLLSELDSQLHRRLFYRDTAHS